MNKWKAHPRKSQIVGTLDERLLYIAPGVYSAGARRTRGAQALPGGPSDGGLRAISLALSTLNPRHPMAVEFSGTIER